LASTSRSSNWWSASTSGRSPGRSPTYRTRDAIAIARGDAAPPRPVYEFALAWADALDAFEGTDRVPLTTVHKSKDLEFDTMVLIGLDDKVVELHSDNPEGLATFFVAVSRAKQRIVITTAHTEAPPPTSPLFDLVQTAGVSETDLTVPALSRT
jgi:UvrD-like helicase family protein